MKKQTKKYISSLAIASMILMQARTSLAADITKDDSAQIKNIVIEKAPIETQIREKAEKKATHSYLDVEFEEGKQYILYRDKGYELELLGLKESKRLALEPGKYRALFKFVKDGRYYLLEKKAEVKPYSVSKISLDKKELKTYKLKLDPKIDFIAFSQADHRTDKIIPYSTLASELTELVTNADKFDININDGKSELWLKHSEPAEASKNYETDQDYLTTTKDQDTINIDLDFKMHIKNIDKSQPNYEIETLTPNGYILSYYTYNDTVYTPDISFKEMSQSELEIEDQAELAKKTQQKLDLVTSNTWQEMKLKRKPLDGRAEISLNIYDNIFPYQIELENTSVDIKDHYTKAEERIKGPYPEGLKAAIYLVEKEGGVYSYKYQKEYDLESKRSLILPGISEGQIYAARLYGQRAGTIYDHMIVDIRDKKDLLEARLPKGTTLFMSEDFKEKIDDIALLQPAVDGDIYTFDPKNISKIATNFSISPIIELGIKSGDYRYYLSHRADRTYFPMKTTKIDIVEDNLGIPKVGDMVVSTDRLRADQSFLFEAISKDGKILEPQIESEIKEIAKDINEQKLPIDPDDRPFMTLRFEDEDKHYTRTETQDGNDSSTIKADLKAQFDLGDGRIYFADPLEKGKLKLNIKYDIENPLFDLSEIGHMKEIIDSKSYKDPHIYPTKTSSKLYDLRLKPEKDTLDTAKYKVYNSSGQAKSIHIIEKDGGLYLDLDAQDFTDTYTLVIDYLKLKNRTLKNAIFEFEHRR